MMRSAARGQLDDATLHRASLRPRVWDEDVSDRSNFREKYHAVFPR